MVETLRSAAERYEAVAEELESAARHARVSAGHLRDGEFPRAGAHAFALQGHLVHARRGLDGLAAFHAERSRAE